MELACTACGWQESCGPTAMLERLRAVKMLRPGGSPDPELLEELFIAAAAKSTCPDCGRLGLAVRPDSDGDDWPEARHCAACRKPISAERLAALPSATLCAECQRTDERGGTTGPADYCPRCGSVMQLQPSRGPGVTRYVLTCPACRR